MKTLAELAAIREKSKSSITMREENDENIRVVVGMATCGIAAGARPVLAEFVSEVANRKLSGVTITQTGCIGVCRLEPVVEVFEQGKEKVTYIKMTTEKVSRIVTEHLVNRRPVVEYTIDSEK